jgi:hypothetical protein
MVRFLAVQVRPIAESNGSGVGVAVGVGGNVTTAVGDGSGAALTVGDGVGVAAAHPGTIARSPINHHRRATTVPSLR